MFEQAHAQFALVGGEGGFGGGDGFEHGLGDFKAGAVGAGDGALKGAARTGGDVQVDFEAGADHAHGIEDAGLIVDDELARQQVQDLAIGRALHGAGTLDGGLHVFAGNFAHAAAQIETAVGVDAEDVRTAHADHALVDVGASHALGVLVGGLDHFRRGPEFGDESLAHACRIDHGVAAIAQRSLIEISGQHPRRHAADVERDDQIVLALAHGRLSKHFCMLLAQQLRTLLRLRSAGLG